MAVVETVGIPFRDDRPALNASLFFNLIHLKGLVGATGIEPVTPPV